MTRSSLVASLLLLATCAVAQIKPLDSIERLIATTNSDTQRINLKLEKLKILGNVNFDSAIMFGTSLVGEAKKINYPRGEAMARIKLAGDFNFTGQFAVAKKYLDTTRDLLSHYVDSIALAKMYNIYGSMYSMQNKFDSAHPFFNKSIEIARLLNDKNLLGTALQNNAIAFQQESNYPQALTSYQEALNAAEQINDEDGEAYIYVNIAITYTSLDDKKRAEESYLKAIAIANKLQLNNVAAYSYSNLASLYNDLKDYRNQYNAAIKAASLGKKMGDRGIEASSLSRAGEALVHQDKYEDGKKLITDAIVVADSSRVPLNIFQAYGSMGGILHKREKYAEAIPYFERAFHSISESEMYNAEIQKTYADLSDCYEKTGSYYKALAAYKIAAKIYDTISRKENIKKATELTLNYEFAKKQQIAKDEQQKQNDLAKARQKGLVIGLILTFLLGAVALNGFRNKRRSNILLQQQNHKIEATLSELRSAQAQLVQSEKMASLGELTAGIAHEIQNPLNFVNNFSELNTELSDELLEEAERGNINEIRIIAKDIQANSEKISHHGKRAGAIVKGMLQHSQATTGQKQLTDINKFVDEYFRLAAHGMKAKDPEFNVTMKTDFDDTIGKINMIPQDIGRVLLNLFNNAFYAVSEKKRSSDKSYEPRISVTTKTMNDKIAVAVKDNGTGIPQKLIEKIFQPFFTTKPTGLGTGLGLSLSYDIIKAHGGEVKVESIEGQGTIFTFQLPKKSAADNIR